MHAPTRPPRRWINSYNTGQPYAPARGRFAPRGAVEDDYALCEYVMDLDRELPTTDKFVRCIRRELKIRFFQQSSQRNYSRELRTFLDWVGNPPHQATREDVRDFLEFLADCGRSSSTVSNYLTAIRNGFDKMCGRHLTLGLRTPRRPNYVPVVLDQSEVEMLLKAAVKLRDKLLLGMLYATGARNKEVCRLRWRDIDFERRIVRICQGKGRRDRHVMLPVSFEPLLREISAKESIDGFVFPGRRAGRYLSPRTVQRVMERTVRIAKIRKRATPHTLRHSFAAHLFEEGVDIRHIQKLLGHVRLETTTIYVKVARGRSVQLASPLDRLVSQRKQTASGGRQPTGINAMGAATCRSQLPTEVGRLKVHLRAAPDCRASERRAQVTLSIQRPTGPLYLTGIVVTEMRPGWLNVQVPPLERWAEAMSSLSTAQRERLESPEFFETLQQAISQRFDPALFSLSG